MCATGEGGCWEAGIRWESPASWPSAAVWGTELFAVAVFTVLMPSDPRGAAQQSVSYRGGALIRPC